MKNLESVEVINDLKVSKVAGPSRSTRKLRRTHLEASESVEYKQGGSPLNNNCLFNVVKGLKRKKLVRWML